MKKYGKGIGIRGRRIHREKKTKDKRDHCSSHIMMIVYFINMLSSMSIFLAMQTTS
jgi:hypothetical protein